MEQSVIDAAYWRAVRRQALLGGALALAAVVVAWFLVQKITRPLVLGPHFWPIVGHTAWLIVLTAGLYAIPVRAMRRRLIA